MEATVNDVAPRRVAAAAERQGWLELSGDFLQIKDSVGTAAADLDQRIMLREAGDREAWVDGVLVRPAPRIVRQKQLQLGWAEGGAARPDPTP